MDTEDNADEANQNEPQLDNSVPQPVENNDELPMDTRDNADEDNQNQPQLDHSVPHVESFPTPQLEYYRLKADKSTQTCFKSNGSASQVLSALAQVRPFKTELPDDY